MAYAQNELVINKPVGVVFKFLANGLNNPQWRPGVIGIKLAAGQNGRQGARYAQVMKGPGGRNIAGDYQITVIETNKQLGFVVIAGPARPTGRYYFKPVKEGTKVKFVLDFQPRGLARLMGPMIQRTMISEVGQLDNLKRVLEA